MNAMACLLKRILLALILLGSLGVSAQGNVSADSVTTISFSSPTTTHKWRKVIMAPSILVGAGLLSLTDNEVLDRYEIHEERQEKFSGFRTHFDDYLQYAPIATVYGLNLAGVKGEHDFLNRTVILVKSEIFMMAMVIPLKKFTAVPRPDTGAKTSFPSGHTAQAFAAATFLHKEYGKDHPIISVLGYAAATGVGVMRVMNNRHWSSDVLAGAGIGILATNLAYITHRRNWGGHHGKRKDIVVLPTYGQQSMGMYFAMKL